MKTHPFLTVFIYDATQKYFDVSLILYEKSLIAIESFIAISLYIFENSTRLSQLSIIQVS
jgi:hypothetical protein